MRKVILEVAVSIDGLIEGPNGEYDWCFDDQDYGLNEFANSVDTVFYGRKSYELFATPPPEIAQSESQNELWDSMPDKKKYVFSRTLKTVEGATIISKNIVEEVAKIKKQKGKNIWLFGGASLITAFINLGLVDEIRMAVHPIILGAGKPLFIDIKERKKLKLLTTKVYSTGLVSLHYEVDGKV
jgi:dihydrofolate reductase